MGEVGERSRAGPRALSRPGHGDRPSESGSCCSRDLWRLREHLRMASRTSWEGYLRLNLLSVPVKAYGATATVKGKIGFGKHPMVEGSPVSNVVSCCRSPPRRSVEKN